MSENLEKKVKMTKIKKAILASVASIGFLSLSMAAPGILKMLKFFGVDKKWKKDPKYSFWASIRTLEKDGLVLISKEKGKDIVSLTDSGRKHILLYGIGNHKKRRWDGKWRVLIFDVPEHRKKTRDKIRHTLLDIGFFRLQDSVWVYPYDCEEVVSLMKVDFRIGSELLYLIVEAMEGDSFLKSKFKVDF